MKTGERKLKVYKKFVSRGYGHYAVLPEIRLCGVWLQEAGFESGQDVTVTHKNGHIVIVLGSNETS